MSGSIDYLSLYQGSSSYGTDTITPLITQLLSGAASSGGDPIAALSVAERNQTADVTATASQPQVQRTLAAFSAAVATAKTPVDLLANPAALTVLLTVNGLGSQGAYTALAQKALLSNPNDPTSLASQLSATNSNWKSAAATYQFATKGLAVLRDPATLATISRGYAEVAWRQSLDQTTPGLSNALDFRARAKSIKGVDDILGDATFRTVVTTALGIPPQIAFQELGAQELAISSRLDVARLQDPRFVESITQQYLLAASGAASGTSSGSSLDSLAAQASSFVA